MLVPDERFTFHASRMRMKHVTPEELARNNAQTERATVELADARPATRKGRSSAFCRARNSTSPSSPAPGPCSGAGGDGVHRIAMVTPHLEPLTRLVADHIEDAGVQV
jgi:maleate isomerase